MVLKEVKLTRKCSSSMRKAVRDRNQIGSLMIQMCASFLGQNEDPQESEKWHHKYQTLCIFIFM